MLTLSPSQTRLLRFRHQRFAHPASPGSVLGTVHALCAIQAQDDSAAPLSLRARCPGLTAVEVDHALLVDRSIVRTWAMRATLHWVPTEDMGWLLALLGPVFLKAGQRRANEVGLSQPILEVALPALRDILAKNGPLPRPDIAARLDSRGIHLEGQALYHLLHRAALQGLVCFGPPARPSPGPHSPGDPTFVLVEDWLGAALDPPADPGSALPILAERYLSAYAPATLHDFAAWSGLPISQARRAFAALSSSLVEVEAAGASAWMLESQLPALDAPQPALPTLRLVPSFDTYLLGYRDRSLSVPPAHARRIHPGGGVLHPALLIDGLAAGVWRARRQNDHLAVRVEPFAPLGVGILPALEAEVGAIAHFYGQPSVLELLESQ